MGGIEVLHHQAIDAEPPDRNAELLRYVEAETLLNPGGFALVVIDLDDLKLINERYGHPEGDRYLANMTDILESTVRSKDRLPVPRQRLAEGMQPGRPKDTVLVNGAAWRAHGDEYWLVLRDITDYGGVVAFMRRMQTELDDLGIAASMGGIVHTPGQTAMEMYEIADARAALDKLLRIPERPPMEEDELLYIGEELAAKGVPPRTLEKELASIALRRALKRGETPDLVRIAQVALDY